MDTKYKICTHTTTKVHYYEIAVMLSLTLRERFCLPHTIPLLLKSNSIQISRMSTKLNYSEFVNFRFHVFHHKSTLQTHFPINPTKEWHATFFRSQLVQQVCNNDFLCTTWKQTCWMYGVCLYGLEFAATRLYNIVAEYSSHMHSMYVKKLSIWLEGNGFNPTRACIVLTALKLNQFIVLWCCVGWAMWIVLTVGQNINRTRRNNG